MICIPLNPQKNIGGVGSVARNLVSGFIKNHKILSDNNINIHFKSPVSNNVVNDDTTSSIEYSSYNVKVHPILFGSYYAKKNFSKKFPLKKIDIVHSHDPYFALASLNKKIKTFFTLHGVIWEEYRYRRLKIYPFPTMLKMSKLFDKLDKFVAISEYIKKEIQLKYDYPIEKISTIENPISDDFFLEKKWSDDNLIFCPGVISKRKNQMMLINSIIRLVKSGIKDFKVVLTGYIIDKSYYQMLIKKVNNNDLSNIIEFKGNISYQELLDLYSKSSVVVLTSRQETAPMVISEAMATGTPIISSNICGAPYMINEGIDGYLVREDDSQDLYEKLSIIIEDDKKKRKMGIFGKEKAQKRWKCEKISKELIDLYLHEME